MPETLCDSNLSPICIIPTHTAIENVANDPNMSVGKIIGTFGPEIMAIIGATAFIAGTKRGRNGAKKVFKLLDTAWYKMVVEPDRKRYAHLHDEKDVS